MAATVAYSIGVVRGGARYQSWVVQLPETYPCDRVIVQIVSGKPVAAYRPDTKELVSGAVIERKPVPVEAKCIYFCWHCMAPIREYESRVLDGGVHLLCKACKRKHK